MKPPIYLDHHSTTPCHPDVVAAMLPYFSESFGNPAAITHPHGRKASTAVEEARISVADFFRVRPAEVFFTAGATESNNTVLLALRTFDSGHLITSAIEHKSVSVPATTLRRLGFEVTELRCDHEGFVDPDELRRAMRTDTRLVSVMTANGEIGTIEPIAELAAICRERDVPFHTDATQAAGKIALDSSEIRADFISISAHKLYGPKGVGALIVRSGRRLEPLLVGGGQEKRLRSGTVNVPGVVGLARALEIRGAEMREEAVRLSAMRNWLWDRITGTIPAASVHGPRELRLPGNLNVTFPGVEAEALIHAMRNFSLSSGSACSSGDREPSSVLLAVGVDEATAMTSIRIGLGRTTSQDEIELLLSDLQSNVARLREMSVGR
jgi:cysteine desulfurase